MNILSSLAAGVQDELAALLGGLSQATRLLRLQLAPGVLVSGQTLTPERLHAVEALCPDQADDAPCGFRLTLTAVSPQDDLDLAALLGQPARVDLLLADQALRPFHGRITAATHLGRDAGPLGGGLSRYQLVIEPWLAFLAQRHDAFVFQDQTVPQILESVFGDYTDSLGAAWRFDLADASVYPRRSLCVQHEQSDLAFVQRLLREEGLFAWFEHTRADDDTLGRHTLVIADHNGALTASAQPVVRYTQAGATLAADALQRFTRRAALAPSRVALASFDYRTLGQRPGTAESPPAAGLQADLAWRDQPGLYGWEDAAQAQRLAQRQLDALQSRAARSQAAGTVRAFAPGSWFTLADHSGNGPEALAALAAAGSDAPDMRYAILRVEHRARNNLGADAIAGNLSRPGQLADNASAEPLYVNQATVQPLAVPVRAALADAAGPAPLGVQTAIVVGVGAPVHADRDHRIKVQFHWQRGAGSSSRRDHPSESNAPADAASGTWVRVAETLAGPNWGAHFTPRVGQEVLVDFIEGDIERPVVIGSVYNGAGSGNAQGNDVPGGGAGSSGNAPAWFPGDEAAGEFDSHAHAAVLSGFKTQELDASATGSGGHNHLVLDDTPGQSRLTLGTTQAATHLSIGHLLNQQDNQRLHARGHGLELATTAWGAVRAGQALLLSAHGQRGGSTQANASLDSRAPQAQLSRSAQLQSALTQSAHAQQARLPNEADTLDATQAAQQTLQAWQGTVGVESDREAGGLGTAAAANRPDLLLASPAGIAAHTPQHHLATAGSTLSLTSGQDVNVTAQQHLGAAAKSGLVLYTVGQATKADKPNQETGLKLHAASGSVSVQAQGGALNVNAQQAVTLDSTQGSIQLSAPSRILLVGAGSALEINGADITLTTSGTGAVHAASKVWTGGGSAGVGGLHFNAPTELHLGETTSPTSLRFTALGHDSLLALAGWSESPYRITNQAGDELQAGTVGPDGRLARTPLRATADRLTLHLGTPAPTLDLIADSSTTEDVEPVDGVEQFSPELLAELTQSKYFQMPLPTRFTDHEQLDELLLHLNCTVQPNTDDMQTGRGE